MQAETRVIKEDKDYLVLFKESGLDTVPLKKEREKPSLLSYASSLFPDILSVHGDNIWECGVLHRLDRPTSGLVLIARNDEFYNKMKEEQREGRFIKHYVAKTEQSEVGENFPPFNFTLRPGTVISSKFRPYGKGGKEVRPVIPGQFLYNKIDREYETYIDHIDGRDFYITLKKGYRHQIRCHLSWSSNAIVGDSLYGGMNSREFGLISYSLEFLNQKIEISM